MTFEYKPEEYRYIKQERQYAQEKIKEWIDDLGMNPFALSEYIRRYGVKKAIEAGVDKQSLSYAFGHTAYTYQIDNYCHPRESIDYAASLCPEYEADWLSKAKNERYGYNEVIMAALLDERSDYFEGLPAPINVTTLKKDVGKSRSLNQGLRKLHGYQKIEMELTEMKQRIAALEAAQINVRIDIESIQAIVESVDVPPKERARLMKARGCTIKAIARELGVHRNTVRGWLKE